MNKQPNSRMCFVCGRQNPVGLKMDFYEDPEAGQVRAEFVVPEDYQGYPGVVHGGIVAAILDEVAGRAVLIGGSEENLMVTLRLTIRYRRPTPTGTPLTAVGWVRQAGGVGARVSGEIRLPDGAVTAECESILGAVPESFRDRWEEERPYWKVYG
ncbi:MAG TPA: PaaI family thioesterase [Anaerolineales bacterium]|nr:PaaI family thioesterase [Anaerolineae bacterium]HIQ01748.1 PaaI family thioesterase [Anaerolineales bacterium]